MNLREYFFQVSKLKPLIETKKKKQKPGCRVRLIYTYNMVKKLKHESPESTMSKNHIQDRAVGALLGAWIGDALGLGPH